ncbi:renalase [Nephila pilipes]|uniref:Renalase n=1 Tax=Nephila pilipes TaxID=299642 RepID=A0A8X6QG39_NEPPI|nr:renalase [Nephila pilipes]
MVMNRLGIVGCGITGAVTAMLLKHEIPHLNIVILEKSKGTGGRMSTSRSSFGSSVDLGAQFITKTCNLTKTQEKFYHHLLEDGILQPMPENIEGLRSISSAVGHFICPQGSGSLVKYFLKKSECEILFEHKVTKISSSNEKWKTSCENGTTHEFDALILTIPVPQVLQLDGLTPYLENDQLENLKSVEYCSRYAVGFFYKNEPSFFKDVLWCAKFLSDDIIRYCSLDVHKRKATTLPSVVFHTSKEFGKAYIDQDTSVVQDIIVQRIQELFPQMPIPEEIKCHKWRYSQVEKNYCSEQGCTVLSHKPLLICGGDGFFHSNFEGCFASAESIVKKTVKK